MTEDRAVTYTFTFPLISRDPQDLGTPGVWVEVDPDAAEDMGAIEETAVSLADVIDHTDASHYAQTVTDSIILSIKQHMAPWQRPWPSGTRFAPFNPASGRPYRAINALWLMAAGHADPRWLTEQQIADVGAQLRPGEQGAQIQYWLMRGPTPHQGADARSLYLERPRVKTDTLYNAGQVDGLPMNGAQPVPDLSGHDRAWTILAESGADIRHHPNRHPSYDPISDRIVLPERGSYPTADEYYAAALHQLARWTSAPHRLGRDARHSLGSLPSAREELRVQIASLLLGSELALGHYPASNLAHQLGWLRILQAAPTEIFRAASDAQRIVDFLCKPRDPLTAGPLEPTQE